MQKTERFWPAIHIPGDAVKGEQVYGEHCAVCHRAGDDGPEFVPAAGPDLATVSQADRTTLIDHIIHPNGQIDGPDEPRSVILKDGTELTGKLARQQGGTFSLELADGTTLILQQENIGNVRLTNRSLMPEGLADGLMPNGMADLLRFIEELVSPKNRAVH